MEIEYHGRFASMASCVFHGSLLLRVYNVFSVEAMLAVRMFAQSQYENTVSSYSENTIDSRAILTGLQKFKSFVKLHLVLPPKLLGLLNYALTDCSSYPFGSTRIIFLKVQTNMDFEFVL
jgi:hypothetical protein